MSTPELVQLMGFSLFSIASVILLYFMVVYVQFVLTETYRHGWWLLAVAAGAGVLYGVSGVLKVYAGVTTAELFRQGSSLFFILFLALGIRSIGRLGEHTERAESSPFLGYGFDMIVIGLFVAVWWSLFALWKPTWFVILHSFGWIFVIGFSFYFAIRAVRRHEGTSLAGVVRDLLPVVVSFGLVLVTEIVYQYSGRWANVTEAVWIVGTILASAFLFNTAITIRQERAELNRIYDPSTWREQ